MKYEVMLTLHDQTVIATSYTQVVPIVGDWIFITENQLFKVQERFLHLDSNKVVLIGELK